METYARISFREFTTERIITRAQGCSRSNTIVHMDQPSWEEPGENPSCLLLCNLSYGIAVQPRTGGNVRATSLEVSCFKSELFFFRPWLTSLRVPAVQITANLTSTAGNSKSKSHASAIAGGVVGGIAALLASGAISLVVLRRWRQSHTSASVGSSLSFDYKEVADWTGVRRSHSIRASRALLPRQYRRPQGLRLTNGSFAASLSRWRRRSLPFYRHLRCPFLSVCQTKSLPSSAWVDCIRRLARAENHPIRHLQTLTGVPLGMRKLRSQRRLGLWDFERKSTFWGMRYNNFARRGYPRRGHPKRRLLIPVVWTAMHDLIDCQCLTLLLSEGRRV